MRVFVYGTLMRDEPNHPRLAGARFVGSAETVAQYTLLDLGPYPALAIGGDCAVRGELFEVEEEELAALDAFEGDEFVRAEVALRGGGTAQAWLAATTPRDVRAIRSGDWRRRSW
jgi:gamma-glutamylcyclotransferase (GGCT)/AIG2-like uncharacterized protein YtfP